MKSGPKTKSKFRTLKKTQSSTQSTTQSSTQSPTIHTNKVRRRVTKWQRGDNLYRMQQGVRMVRVGRQSISSVANRMGLPERTLRRYSFYHALASPPQFYSACRRNFLKYGNQGQCYTRCQNNKPDNKEPVRIEKMICVISNMCAQVCRCFQRSCTTR